MGRLGVDVAPRGVADVDFRDIEAIDERTVFLMSSGEGPHSRIYKTTDGGASWMLLTTNLEPKGFWDCMGFWDSTHGIIVGDPVDGRFTIMTTSDGATWQKMKGPSANKDEGAFAAQRHVRVHARHSGSLVRDGRRRRGARVSFRGWRADVVRREDADPPRFRERGDFLAGVFRRAARDRGRRRLHEAGRIRGHYRDHKRRRENLDCG